MKFFIGPAIVGFGTAFFLNAIGIEPWSGRWWLFAAVIGAAYFIGLVDAKLTM